MKCPVCNSHSTCSWSDKIWVMIGSNREFTYRNCTDCGTVFCDPLPEIEELAAYYSQYFNFSWFEEHLPFKKIQAAHRWRRMEPLFNKYHIHQGRLLDVGCGHGLFLTHAKKSGWMTKGIDYPSLATRHAREQLDLEIIEGDLRTVADEGKLNNLQFDFITAWHCLEHDTDTLAYLRGINKLLAPRGKVLIAVPNAEAIGMKLMRENWVWCQQPYVHIIHFTEMSLTILLRRAGMNVLAAWNRNTWDAHPAFDVHVSKYLNPKLRHLRRISKKAAFWVEEGCRLASYTASCHNHWLSGIECVDSSGSELLLLAERVDT